MYKPVFACSLRTLLLLTTTAIVLIACDETGGDNSAQTQAEQYRKELDQKIASLSAPLRETYPARTVAGLYLAGQLAQSNGDWKKAADYLAGARELDADAAHLDTRIMVLSLGSGQYDQALTIAKKITSDKAGTDESLASLLLAADAFRQKNYAGAIAIIEKAPQKGVGSAVYPLVRTWALMASDRKAEAITPFAVGTSPSLAYQAVLIAAYGGQKQKLDELARDIDFTTAPVTIRQLDDIAAIFAMNGQTAAATKIYTTLRNALAAKAPQYTAYLNSLNDNKLETIPQPIITPHTALSQAFTDVSKILSANFQDSARVFAHLSLMITPTQEESLEFLAGLAAQAQQYDDATSFLTRIDTRNDEDKRQMVQRQIALLLQDAGKNNDAIRVLEILVKETKNVEAQVQIGDIYRGDENYPEALTAYNKAFEILGDNIPQEHWGLLFSRGMVHERLRNWEQAEKDLQAALRFEPDEPYILNYLGYSWADQGRNLEKAATMIEKAARLRPRDGSIVDSLGWVYFRMGKYDKAVKTLERAIELVPTEAEINDHLGDAYWKVGRKNEARFQWNRAVSFTKDAEIAARIADKAKNGLTSAPTITRGTATENLVKNKADDARE